MASLNTQIQMKQLALGVSQPHHTTVLKYPTIALLIDDVETEVLYPPECSSNLHVPSDLIHNELVVDKAKTDNVQETSFFTIERADPKKLRPYPQPLDVPQHAFIRFVHDVHHFQQTIGTTRLDFVTYASPGNPDMIRVLRKSASRRAGGKWSTTSDTFDFAVDMLVQHSAGAPAFVEQMLMLIFRKNSRAMKHVALTLAEYEIYDDLDEYGVKTERTIDYLATLDVVCKPAILPLTEDEECSICHIDFSSADDTEEAAEHDPVTLPCGHLFGKSCLSRWYNGDLGDGEIRNPSNLTCPLCRAQILTPPIIRGLEFGLTNGVYLTDDRYTGHENFERSCADLDLHPEGLSIETQTPIPRFAVLHRAFDVLLEGALLETWDSTPLNLQPVRFSELDLARTTFRRQSDSETRDRKSVAQVVKAVYSVLIAHLHNSAALKMRDFVSHGEELGWRLKSRDADTIWTDIRFGRVSSRSSIGFWENYEELDAKQEALIGKEVSKKQDASPREAKGAQKAGGAGHEATTRQQQGDGVALTEADLIRLGIR